MAKEKVLILCTHNSVRSQIAEGLFRHLAQGRFEVKSAGIYPCMVNPYVKVVLGELGIDVSGQYSKSVLDFQNEKFDYVITVCDGAKMRCPLFLKEAKKIHWPTTDPAFAKGSEEKILKEFRITRDKLKILITGFLKEEGEGNEKI